MARKPTHFTTYTAEEVHLRFKAAVESLGMRVSDRDAQIHELPIDGIRVGDRKSELRKPGTSYYGQTFVEARSTAGLMVDLGLAPLVADIKRHEPPLPDVEVCLRDGTSIFIEQTMVMDSDAHHFSTTIEETNILINRAAETDHTLERVLNGGIFTIRLDRLNDGHLTLALRADALAAEVCVLARQLHGPISLGRPERTTYPLLAQLNALYFYQLKSRTGSAFQPPADHGRLHMFTPALRERLRSKLGKVSTYPPACRPLWLVLDVDHHFPSIGSRLDAIARNVVKSEKPHGFDRIVVQQMRHAPIVIEPFAVGAAQ